MEEKKLLITLIRKKKLLTDDQIQEILKEHRKSGNSLPYIILKNKYLANQDLQKILTQIRKKQALGQTMIKNVPDMEDKEQKVFSKKTSPRSLNSGKPSNDEHPVNSKAESPKKDREAKISVKEDKPKRDEDNSNLTETETLDKAANITKERKFSPTSIAPGERFGPYSISSKLGEGGAGVVYKAIDVDTNKIVALKLLFTQDDPTLAVKLKRIKREFEAAKLLDHTNIVSIHDTGVCENILYFVMDFIEGKRLRDHIRERSFSLNEFIEIVEKTARALYYAHSQGIVHRDIKPENILVTPEKEPKITDFGLAKRIDAESVVTQPGTLVGSLYYMAPEQLYGKKTDFRSDVYSLGIILYEILTGKLPFESDSVGELLNKMATVDPPPPQSVNPEVDPNLELICLKAIQKSPGERYITARAMADDIKRYLNGLPVHAKSDGSSGRRHKQTGENPKHLDKLHILLICLFLFCVCLLLIYLIVAQFLPKSS